MNHDSTETSGQDGIDRSVPAISDDFTTGFSQDVIGHALNVLFKSLTGSSIFVRPLSQ